MRRIAFVTCSTKPGFADDDLVAVRLLESAGVEVKAVPWDGTSILWPSFDAVVLRSCWNYHLQPEKFLQWLDQLQTLRVNLHNPGTSVRWNLHKNYLMQLSHQGIPLPPTVWLPRGEAIDLSSLLKEKKWSKAVVKPAISATAFKTFLTSPAEAAAQQTTFGSLLSERDLIVQQFMPEVLEQGEWSLLFFNKQFSHAVLKKPKAKDFRVQDNFGGTAVALSPPPMAVEQAQRLLGLVDEPLLYARVDGIVSENKFLLMELELIEPVLFLSLDKNAPEKLARAILQLHPAGKNGKANKKATAIS